MDKSRFPDWVQVHLAELEAQLNRTLVEEDWDCLDVNEAAKTITVASDPLLSEIRGVESTRNRGLDLPPNP